MGFQPDQLRDFHFRRNRSADIAQDIVAALVDRLGFRQSPVIHPDNHIAGIFAAWGNRQRPVFAVQHDQRARCIKSEADHLLRLGAAALNDLPDNTADGGPNIVRRLLRPLRLRLPHLDRLRRRRPPPPVQVKQPRPRTSRADIYPDDELFCVTHGGLFAVRGGVSFTAAPTPVASLRPLPPQAGEG